MNMFRKSSKRKGFTLLEIIIVIIILAVLASLAFPAFVSTIHSSYGGEALTTVTTVRGSVERCALQANQALTNCGSFANLDVADPGTPGQANFTYAITTAAASVYTIIATRKTVRGGATTSFISYVVTPSGVIKSGGSAFSGIQ